MIKNLKNYIDLPTKSTNKDKELYGEVLTPFSLVNDMLDIIPKKDFTNLHLKWLDPGTGTGNYSIVLYFRLLDGLKDKITDIEERKDYIIENMIYMVELRDENVETLKYYFGENANIIHENYLDWNPYNKFDYIIGNPPFNFNGLKKVPTNNKTNKKHDGYTVWNDFVKKNISLLKRNSKMCILIPSIWLKPDRERMYYYLLQYNIKFLNCFSNTETNKIFKGKAQTPSCYFLLTKTESDRIINIYDREKKQYIDFSLKKDIPIPLCNIEDINYFQNYFNKFNCKCIDVIKTNLPPKNITLSQIKTDKYIYPNIRTRLLKDKELIIEYSNKPLFGYGKPKLVLANKMYGLPYLDISGEYGISNRDNYVIYKENVEDIQKLFDFLSTNRIQKVYESTRYRMKYLEKYAFQLLPDITLIDYEI